MENAKRVLVVDDDRDVRDFCAAVLQPQGFQVLGVGEARLARQSVIDFRPDLLILDVMMEESDAGFVLVKQLAAEFKDLPVLMLSSIIESAALNFEVYELPAAAFAQKPLLSQDLLRLVNQLLDRKPPTR